MGNVTTKFFPLSDNDKKIDKEPINVQINKMKQDEQNAVHEYRISPHFGKSGLAFYAPLEDAGEQGDHIDKIWPGFEIKSKSSTDSLRSIEREIMAGIIVALNLQEKVRKARMTDEKRLLVLRRRERKEEEMRNKYEGKMKKMEERKQELQNRLLPPNLNVRSFYNH